MSAQPVEQNVANGVPGEVSSDPASQTPLEPSPDTPRVIEIRRNAGVSILLGAASSAIAIAYLARATQTGGFLDWLLFVVLAVMAGVFFRGLLDARLPLLVADDMGVRFRLGSQWRGLPWEAIDRVLVTPRRGLLRDGRLIVKLHHMHRAIEGIEGRAKRHATLNQKMYGAVLALPLGVTTRATETSDERLSEAFSELSRGRAEVVTLLPDPELLVASSAPEPKPNRAEARKAAEEKAAEEKAARNARTIDAQPNGVVIDVEDPAPAKVSTAASGKVRAIARLGEPVAPLVIEDFEPQPAYNPVIGPELAAARTRVGMSVDDLAERTRIRPHVIESIEVDDFVPCGGDFYARGHIRTLARTLGKDPAPMLAQFDDRYATAPISPRKVFEAELATGMTGSMRSTAGGPNWALLIGVVLTLILVWSLVRLFSVDNQTAFETPPPVLNGSAGLNNGFGAPPDSGPAAPPPMATKLSAVQAEAHVSVRDGEGALVFEGDLVIGEVKTLQVSPPVTVTSDNGGAMSVTVAGRDLGFMGEIDQPATKVYQRPTG